MTYEEIVSRTKAVVMAQDVSKVYGHLAVEINIVGEGSGAFYIELKDRKAYVEPYEYFNRDCRLILSANDYMDIIEGRLDPVKAYTTGKLRVEGKIEKALEFSRLVTAAVAAGKEATEAEEAKPEEPKKEKSKKEKSGK